MEAGRVVLDRGGVAQARQLGKLTPVADQSPWLRGHT